METLKKVWRGLSRTFKILGDPSLRGESRELFERMIKDGVGPADARQVCGRTSSWGAPSPL